MQVPRGVDILSKIYTISAIFGIITSFFALLVYLGQYFYSASTFSVISIIFYIISGIGIAGSVLTGLIGFWDLSVLLTLINQNYFLFLGIVIFAFFAPINLLIGFSLKSGDKWAKYTSIALSMVGLIGAASVIATPLDYNLAVFTIPFGIICMIPCVINVCYLVLSKRVKKFFVN